MNETERKWQEIVSAYDRLSARESKVGFLPQRESRFLRAAEVHVESMYRAKPSASRISELHRLLPR